MSGGVPKPSDFDLERALEVIVNDPAAAKLGLEILREELRTAVGLERQAIIAAITALETSSSDGKAGRTA